MSWKRSVALLPETMKRVKELVQFGGFLDTGYLQRTLGKEFQQMESCFKQAFEVPFTTISKKILFEDLLTCFDCIFTKICVLKFSYISIILPASEVVTTYRTHEQRLVDYISFRIPEDSFSNIRNCIGIARGFMHDLSKGKEGNVSIEVAFESQIILLLNESTTSSESSSNGCMMIVQASDLPFVSISRSTGLNRWNLHELKMENEKVQNIPHFVVAPLALDLLKNGYCRLKYICNKEGLKASSIALTALAEYTSE
ncbi:Anaphase-promoting complex subunit 4 [Camellia lanceoleosa]|uniref:Anaphase-promoting complex subunit 4 n=1 Tax=Camellia lanceoleosa TaxID=1840588 RepID=A0ACC0HIW8_9ERIC|nr:Anaphase-promoting complex subunit 4 [Camellia lanceoleosa]